MPAECKVFCVRRMEFFFYFFSIHLNVVVVLFTMLTPYFCSLLNFSERIIPLYLSIALLQDHHIRPLVISAFIYSGTSATLLPNEFLDFFSPTRAQSFGRANGPHVHSGRRIFVDAIRCDGVNFLFVRDEYKLQDAVFFIMFRTRFIIMRVYCKSQGWFFAYVNSNVLCI